MNGAAEAVTRAAVIAADRSAGGKSVVTGVIVVSAFLIAIVLGRLLSHRVDDRYRKYYTRKIVHYVVAILALIGLGILWRPFAGQLGLLLGLVAAGLVVALQDVVVSLAGWINILSGGIFRVGDRVQFGGVNGDVIDVSPLRTKLMEIGSSIGDESWVRGRQYTGRIVAIANRATFELPVYNYSTSFEFLWEEVTIPIAYRDDWHAAERIMEEEILRISASEEAEAAIAGMVHQYPVARTEVEPRVFVQATDNYLELAARFVVAVRGARAAKDEYTRRVLDRLHEIGITPASTTEDVTIRGGEPVPPAAPNDDGPPAGPGHPPGARS